ncbi:MAG: hypothetical protein LBH24_06185 [Clostridiales bacterium]|nr:hypothetical protein [Clostridiales bacterium]
MQETESIPGYGEQERELTTDVSKCPSCGANLVFSPEEQALKCNHCDTVLSFQKARTEEQDFSKLLETQNAWSDETTVYVCNNCGAKEIVPRESIARHCPFCGTTNVVETQELSGLKPNAVVPFRITKENAVERFKAWVKKKIFAPREFKRSARPETVDGAYNPAFTYDANTFTFYQGRLGRYKTVTTRVNGKTTTRRVLEYFNIHGTYSSFFDDVLIQASGAVPQKTLDKLQPFDTNNAQEYSQNYMHGFTANQYTKDGIKCWEEARGAIGRMIKEAVLRKYTYDVVVNFDARTEYSDVKFKYVLLPLYVGHCTWHKKLYNFFVNGFNGKIHGKTPLSPLRVILAAALGAAVLGGIIAVVVLFVL